MPSPTLQEFFERFNDKAIHGYRVTCHKEYSGEDYDSGRTVFTIHAQSIDSDTLDFEVYGNKLFPRGGAFLPEKDPAIVEGRDF